MMGAQKPESILIVDGSILTREQITNAHAARLQIHMLTEAFKRKIATAFTVDVGGSNLQVPMTVQDSGLLLMSISALLTATTFIKAWEPETDFHAGDVISHGGDYQVVVTGGKTALQPPQFSQEFATNITDGTVTWCRFGQLLATGGGIRWLGKDDVQKASREIMLFVTRQSSALKKLTDQVLQVAATEGATPQDVFNVVWNGEAPILLESFVSETPDEAPILLESFVSEVAMETSAIQAQVSGVDVSA